LRRLLTAHAVSTAYELVWSAFKNGEWLAAAEGLAFAALGFALGALVMHAWLR
jgi:hypothetical protein